MESRNTLPALLGEIPPILTSVYMTSATSGWIVGASPDFKSATYYSGPGFKQPLSTIMRFAPFGSVLSTTVTVTSMSTISTSASATVSTITVTTTTSSLPPAAVAISIKVVDNQGNPVQGANVTIPSLGLQGLTNAQGIVTFTVPPGTYSVIITKGTSATSTITVASGCQTFVLTLPVGGIGGGGIPGFPVESVIGGLGAGLLVLSVIRRRRKMSAR